MLIDGGCSVEGYQSDITRTTVFGKPTQRQIDVWNLEKAGAGRGVQGGEGRRDLRIGGRRRAQGDHRRRLRPRLQGAGLPHRTGHGIGLDGHEWTNFVRGNKTPLAPGMCFSDEPMIAIYGEFGIRLEDCLYITENGPKFFTPQSPAIDGRSRRACAPKQLPGLLRLRRRWLLSRAACVVR